MDGAGISKHDASPNPRGVRLGSVPQRPRPRGCRALQSRTPRHPGTLRALQMSSHILTPTNHTLTRCSCVCGTVGDQNNLAEQRVKKSAKPKITSGPFSDSFLQNS